MSAKPEPEFLCPFCGVGSQNIHDARWRYCGACGVFVDDAGSYDIARQRAEEAVVVAARRLERSVGLVTSLHMTEQRRAVKRLENILACKEPACR